MNPTLEYFSFQAAMYDTYQFSCVPKYEEMISVSTAVLRHFHSRDGSPRLLDAGCGTGNTSSAILRSFPHAQLTCVDGSEEMISAARAKLADQSADFTRVDLASRDWGRTLADRSFDASVSVLVLEHLDFAAYRRCLQEFKRILKPGGILIAVEGYGERLNQELFYSEMALREGDAVRSGLISLELLEDMKQKSAEQETHYFAGMGEKKQWWIDAGFTDVDFVWQYFCVAVLVGRAPGL
jgi:tRNA (cmo5U34)-methyltransferase